MYPNSIQKVIEGARFSPRTLSDLTVRLFRRRPFTPITHDSRLLFTEKGCPKFSPVVVFAFPIPEDEGVNGGYSLMEIAQIFKEGFEEVKRCFPFVTQEAVLDTASDTKGTLRLQDRTDPDQFVVKDLRETFPITYKELRERRFPSSFFNRDDVLSSPSTKVYPQPDPAPVLSAQLTFIRGGALLAMQYHHWYADGQTRGMWLRVWSDQCCRLQGLPVRDALADTDADTFTKGRATTRQHYNKDVLPPPPGGATAFPPPRLPGGKEAKYVSTMFSLSPAAQKQLKADAHPSNCTVPVPDVSFVSSFDAVCALMSHAALSAHRAVYDPAKWATISRAATGSKPPTNEEAAEQQESQAMIMSCAVDARNFLEPRIDPRTHGCFILSLSSVIPEVFAPAPSSSDNKNKHNLNIADLASRARRAYALNPRTHPEQAKELATAYASAMEHCPDVTNVSLTGPFHFLHTTWTALPFIHNWGPMVGEPGRSGLPDCVRPLSSGLMRNVHTVVGHAPVKPGEKEGALEISIVVDEPAVEHLLKDPLLLKYATPLL